MNEFTKDELQDIDFCLRDMKNQGSCDSTWNNDIRLLIIKIQSLIDNYCEHKDFELDDRHYACNQCGYIWQ